MLRVFHPGPWPAVGGEIVLAADESSHLVRVRRARTGEPVTVLDGVGRVGEGSLLVDDAKAARVRLITITRHPSPPSRILAVGLPKGGLFMDIVRQAVELGATEVCPLLTAHSEVHFDEIKLMHKMARWRAAALEACKQSGNPWLTLISQPMELTAWLQKPMAQTQSVQRYVAALTPNAKYLAELCPFVPLSLSPFIICIGPEGDFSPQEYEAFSKTGFIELRLPGHILRVETACVVALAILKG